MKKKVEELPAHSKLGPSKADRWMNCHASVFEEQKYPDGETSIFALEGSAAHRLAELCLNDRVAGRNKTPASYVGDKCDETGLTYNAEMARAVVSYVELCMEQYDPATDTIYVERKLHTPSIHKQMFGTSDCIIVKPGMIVTIDFKYGKGIVVRAKKNTQMLLYTLMAVVANLATIQNRPKKYRQIIVQPRVDDIGSRQTIWDYKLTKLETFERKVRAAVKAIDKLKKNTGVGAVIAREHYAPSESRCHFCRASGSCEAQDTYNLDAMREAFADTDAAAFDEDFNPPTPGELSAARLGFVVAHEKAITNWLAAVKAHAITQLQHNGDAIPHFKLVQGRSNRAWTKKLKDNPKKVAKALKKITPGVDIDAITVLKLFTVNQVQNALGTMTKKQQKRFDKLWSKPPGKPTLVTSEDQRAALSTLSDFN